VRIVSLVPSSTETLVELGADVTACTRFCEQPGLRHVGGTKNPDLDAIVALAPDVVVMDREENRVEDHDALVARGCRVVTSDVRSIDDALAHVDELAALVGAKPPVRGRLPARETGVRRSAFVPIWRRPWMSIGAATYGASVLDHLGIDVVIGAATGPYPSVDIDEIAALAPQLVLVPSEPYEFSDGHVAELRGLMARSEVVRVDGQDLFWWGARTPRAIERLRAVLAPR
jgi:ABC-type Fe3+-hydroxamate transport system substrate-binding protein